MMARLLGNRFGVHLLVFGVFLVALFDVTLAEEAGIEAVDGSNGGAGGVVNAVAASSKESLATQIQALHEGLAELRREIDGIDAENRRLRAKIDLLELENRLLLQAFPFYGDVPPAF